MKWFNSSCLDFKKKMVNDLRGIKMIWDNFNKWRNVTKWIFYSDQQNLNLFILKNYVDFLFCMCDNS